ncbi:RelA/SpoT family protein [Mariprofundus ferrooxydans]|uniref:RelA/SpoT family protein n=2 Tax=Mariprofundus ferrooxydans TaxID=314344 RepID=UPI0006BF260F|nr:bifunctional (p)ppGpp synthetase/guanosine-3',5'-bis(diphosphate) 3'-pyrophosphohydrolase [Mariprofundus ferrooxydans]KON46467.1 (p)ppGpp synthetase [Mariprofundus ferrooxydans]
MVMKRAKQKQNIPSQYSVPEYIDLLIANSAHLNQSSALLEKACQYVWDAQGVDSAMPSSLDVAILLSQLSADETTIIVCLLSDSRLRSTEFHKVIQHEFSDEVVHMVQGLEKLHGFKASQSDGQVQSERLRRMLLAMVDDVRVVLIKLAYRVQRLRELSKADEETQKRIASESLEIFSPIANRLGIGQLKWELEDLSFRYLQPETYKRIANMLEEKRGGRETYIKQVVTEINTLLNSSGIDARVYGRPKHIYSIWSKMTHKDKQFSELFDVLALRITVTTIAECYTVLGLIHGRWHHIPKEFDDYIANTKPNGYQSLHTAVYGPEGKPVEIQIRTKAMHEFAEFGVAAHWRYKERSKQDDVLEKTIHSIRKLLETPENSDEEFLDSFKTELFSDRVFVLSPEGKIIDLPQGATPLDFAYSIHTEVGHKCRGAKVNGQIVPLTTQLQNGMQVEILTTNHAAPSRDWLNPHLGYIASNKARSKIKIWFRQQDYEQNVMDGKTAIDRELKRMHILNPDTNKALTHFKVNSEKEWYAKVGRGDITSVQLTQGLNQIYAHESLKALPFKPKPKKRGADPSINVCGVGNLLTYMANCCKPVPGDEIIGFITQGQGVSVHRPDCTNILNLEHDKQKRLISVEWADHDHQTFEIHLVIEAIDRTGLLKDITSILSDLKVNVLSVQTLSNKDTQTADMQIMMEIEDLEQLQKVTDKIMQLPNVLKVYRQNA